VRLADGDLDGIREHKVEHRRGRQADTWWPVGDALRACTVGRIERGLSDGGDFADTAVEDVGRREQGEPGVMVVVVAPAEEVAQPGAAVKFAGKAAGVVRLIHSGLESRLGERLSLDTRSEWIWSPGTTLRRAMVSANS
jgi:hypothetical protein